VTEVFLDQPFGDFNDGSDLLRCHGAESQQISDALS
jgi:hypothetical protein